MTEPTKSDVLPSTSKNHLIRLAVALALALICWPTALYALHTHFFRSGDTTGNGHLLFAVGVSVVAVVATWMVVFMLSGSEE